MFYKISGGAFSSISDKDTSFSIKREFRNDDILKAREECFKAFHSYVEVFLQGIDKDYINYEQATHDLQCFFVSHRKKKLEMINDDEFFQISFIHDETADFISKDKKVIIYKGEIVIHGMGAINRDSVSKKTYLRNLILEKSIYKQNKLNYKDNEYFNAEPNVKNSKFEIINTPIEFQLK